MISLIKCVGLITLQQGKSISASIFWFYKKIGRDGIKRREREGRKQELSQLESKTKKGSIRESLCVFLLFRELRKTDRRRRNYCNILHRPCFMFSCSTADSSKAQHNISVMNETCHPFTGDFRHHQSDQIWTCGTDSCISLYYGNYVTMFFPRPWITIRTSRVDLTVSIAHYLCCKTLTNTALIH